MNSQTSPFSIIWISSQCNSFAPNQRMLLQASFCPIFSLLQSEVSQDVPHQALIDLAVSRNALLLACVRIHVDVMVTPGAQQHASLLLEPPKQCLPFHTIATSRIWYSSGTSSRAVSMKASRIFRSNSSRLRPCVMISGCSSSLPSQNFLLFQ